uniref:BRICHOS domain containing 5 n=2 Tax=Iconisemion striatum TaxID=60296 RepID=A0A1A7XKY8_9TELE
MVRCWKRSEERLEEERCMNGAPVWSQCPHKVFWLSLSALLLLLTVAFLGSMGHLWMSWPRSQMVRISAPDQNGVLFNQSAVVDQFNDLVTFSVTSPVNQTSTVLFDVKQGLICYKPVDQDVCFLQIMERSDYDNVNSLLNQSMLERRFQIRSNETQRQTKFLGVLAASQVNVSSLEGPVQVLCQDRSIYWTRRADGPGPGKQRLVYFCIDICFPSNICVSVCFYYLPE